MSDAAREVFVCRRMVPADLAFVIDSWLRSAWHRESMRLKKTHTRFQRINAGRSWFDAVRPRVSALVADPRAAVFVVCDREDQTHIAGWIALQGGQELRSYIKHAYRGWGVDDLLRAAATEEIAKTAPRRIAGGSSPDIRLQAEEAEELL